jgi:alkanesulfonate monooxygenase SsuD/methylene tetrahydromethanopterin reductase-like flavin-dependent oxidoreductase (luciferase family)
VLLSPDDQAAVRRLRDAYDSYQHATAASRHRELVPDRFVDMMALAGTPDEVRGQVRRVASVPEIARIIILPQNPVQGFLERETILRTFATEVMAHVA